jgi:CDP-diacylglycerol---serine O-phosphatidyltransferase
MKQIPNIFTLLNLFFGCLAIVCILQSGLILLPLNERGEIVIPPAELEYTPEKVVLASLFIGIAALIDFLDGFVARLLKASSELGKQLDSLADVVSFGVAPGMILFQFLRLSIGQQEGSLDASLIWLMPALLVPCAGAYRLARFNIDNSQSYGFKGVPIPAVGLLVASFPLIYWYTDEVWVIDLFLNKWFWYAVIVSISYLMVSTLPMLALKFKNASVKKLMPFIILGIIAIITGVIFGWLAVPFTFAAYVIISLIYKPTKS